jgi:hypothetical protein
MPIINICVRNKIASSDCKQYIVCKNDGYVAVFDFDKEWESYELKTAKFAYDEEHYIPVVFRGNQCDIPRLPNTSLCSIEVEAGDIKTAVNAWVHCLPVLDDDYEEIAPPEPNVYDQIMQLINEEFFKGEQNAEEIARILAEITTIYERIVANAESIEANEREFLEALGKKLDNALNIQKDRFVSYDPEKKTMVDTGISVSEIGVIKQSVSKNATNIGTVGDNLADLTKRFNALANSDDRTLDELKEIVA